MSLTIKRSKDNRVVKCVLHRVADIPGGVGINVVNLGGSAILEGTPLAKGENGLYDVVKTAQVITDAEKGATTIEVAKGHHFVVGDYIAFSSTNKGATITAIDRSNAAKDVITIGTALVAAVKAGACGVATASGSTYEPKATAVAIAGSNYDVTPNENVFVDAWVIGVVKEGNAPIVNQSIKNALKGVIYV